MQFNNLKIKNSTNRSKVSIGAIKGENLGDITLRIWINIKCHRQQWD
jgi:hypothetical protein